MLAIDSDRTRRYLSGACVSGLGLLILLVPLYDIWDDLRNLSWGLLWTLLENSALLVLASGLVLAGVWIVWLDWESKYVVTVAKWNLLVGGGIAALFLWIVAIQLRVMQEPKPYVLALNGVLFGVVAAFGVGVYNASRQRHTDELRARERELQRMYDRVSESERRYRTLAERFPDGIVALFDEQPTFYLSAGEAFDQLPLDPADLDGKVRIRCSERRSPRRWNRPFRPHWTATGNGWRSSVRADTGSFGRSPSRTTAARCSPAS